MDRGYRLIRRRKERPAYVVEDLGYCTYEEGQYTLDSIQDFKHGTRYNDSVYYVGRGGENWIVELKRLSDDY